MKKVDIAVQIVNFNTKKYLINCLQSVFIDLADSNLSFEVNVLDNNSKDDLSNLKDFFFPLWQDKLKVYKSNKNLGFGGGHNLLAQKTQAKYLLLLNPDIVIEEPGAIKQLYWRIVNNDSIKVIGPKLYNEKGRDQYWDHGESRGIWAKFLNEISLGFYMKRNLESECAWVSGAVFLIEKEIFDKVGGFDEKFFLYKEEEDLCLRIRHLDDKYKVIYYPKVKVLHVGSVVASKKVYLAASYMYFIKKHPIGKRR